MVVKMTPGLCSNAHSSTGGTFCESCFASFVVHGCAPDRACITDVIDDGKTDVTLILRHGDDERIVLITDENREALAYGGWPGWVRFVEEPLEAAEPAAEPGAA
jgi:hypothetical protein